MEGKGNFSDNAAKRRKFDNILRRAVPNYSIQDLIHIYIYTAKGFGVRHFQVMLFFCGLTIAFALRVNLSVGIVAMTDHTINPDFEVKTCTPSENDLH